ncbi:hypothetical protein HFN_2353 [Helicobacter fennelliae MRY12-0050]|uniref:Uncharacterized protein n=1 Tax=Helicobacter fennelliae MRY12-0050 TaxID=1325130 RepID=T1CX26_9HELI|nr:hypothetical protein HFN_2353 [Helicobacter fennelliae MRY12-0050]
MSLIFQPLFKVKKFFWENATRGFVNRILKSKPVKIQNLPCHCERVKRAWQSICRILDNTDSKIPAV